jgi:hypothetical protein
LPAERPYAASALMPPILSGGGQSLMVEPAQALRKVAGVQP